MNVADWENYADRHRGAIFAVTGGVLGTIQAWTVRGTFTTDLLNYLALARTLLGNGWNSSVNGFWSPLYSWLIALPMSLHLVTARNELLWVHAVNLGIFFAAMFCFHVFQSHVLRFAGLRVGANHPSWPRIETWWYFAGCAVFLYANFEWLPNSMSTPDLLVSAFIYLSSGYFVSILCRDRSWPDHLVLGAALALGYLAKAPAFPLAILFFAMLPFLTRGEKWNWVKWPVSVAAFVLVAGPFIYTLSIKEQHPTFGESARVNFLMYADGAPFYWLGEGLPKVKSSPRFERVCNDPPVFAFHGVQPGVYYPAFEPSQWYAGLVPRLQLRQEVLNLRAGWHRLAAMAEAESDILLGFVVLLLFSGIASGLRAVLSWWFLWLPAAFGIAMFWLVHVEERFIVPFVVLGFVGLYAGLLLLNVRRPRLLIKILMSLVLLQTCRAVLTAGKTLLGAKVSVPERSGEVIDDLGRAGLPKGAKIAVIGNAFGQYWAWMGGYSIVAEVPSSATSRFLSATAAEKARVFACLTKTGAQAVLMHVESPEFLEPGWLKVGGADLYLRVLPNAEPEDAPGPGVSSSSSHDQWKTPRQ